MTAVPYITVQSQWIPTSTERERELELGFFPTFPFSSSRPSRGFYKAPEEGSRLGRRVERGKLNNVSLEMVDVDPAFSFFAKLAKFLPKKTLIHRLNESTIVLHF